MCPSGAAPDGSLAVGALTPGLLRQIEERTFQTGITPRQVRCKCGGWLRTYANGEVSRRFCRCVGNE